MTPPRYIQAARISLCLELEPYAAILTVGHTDLPTVCLNNFANNR